MPDLSPDVTALLAEARQLDDGPGKIELLQEAVRRADHGRDPEAGVEARLQLMESALVCGSADVLLVAYTWCLAQAEHDPDRFNLYEVLWRYRWAIAYMPTFPEMSRDRIDAALADMTVRYKRADVSLRPVHLLRWKVALRMRDGRMASAARRAWRRARRDWLSDDEHTERLTQIDHLLFRRRWADAATAAAGYLNGSTGDDRHLVSLGSKLLVPLLRLGRARRWPPTTGPTGRRSATSPG